MEQCVKDFLEKKGYDINTAAQSIINECDDWYSDRDIDFHMRTTVQGNSYQLEKLNFAKRACSDDANLCEIAKISSESERQYEFINHILDSNNFVNRYRRQLEKVAATGTEACYIRLENAEILADGKVRNGNIKINYVDADCYIPLTVENNEVIEVAFSSTGIKRGIKRTTLVIFTLENGLYVADTHVFDNKGKEIVELSNVITLGDVKPFAILRNAEVNNLDNMDGYGLPKVLNAIPVLKALELCWNVLFGDLDKADKLLLVNEIMCEFGENGNPIFNTQQKKLFVMIGNEKLPDQDSLIKEYNPVIRIGDIAKTFELCLSLLSMMFGYGTKKYTFENGQIKTATEYIGERQDCVQELNKQRGESEKYINDIVKAVLWYSNTFNKTAFNLDEEISIYFDDSFIEDKVTKLERMRTDALSFNIPKITIWYIMEQYNLSEEEAAKLYKESQINEIDEIED